MNLSGCGLNIPLTIMAIINGSWFLNLLNTSLYFFNVSLISEKLSIKNGNQNKFKPIWNILMISKVISEPIFWPVKLQIKMFSSLLWKTTVHIPTQKEKNFTIFNLNILQRYNPAMISDLIRRPKKLKINKKNHNNKLSKSKKLQSKKNNKLSSEKVTQTLIFKL